MCWRVLRLVALAERPGRGPQLHAARMSTISERPPTVESIATMANAIALLAAGASCIPHRVVIVAITKILVALHSLAASQAKAIRYGATLAATLHQVRPIATIERQATMGNAIASTATRVVAVLALVEVTFSAVERLWALIAVAGEICDNLVGRGGRDKQPMVKIIGE